MAHYGMQPTWNNVSVAHENGDVEQSHHRFKEAVDQALRVRASRDFATRAAYEHFVQNLIHKRNQTRVEKFAAEKATLRPLPSRELAPCKELRVVVSQFSTITVATQPLLSSFALDRHDHSGPSALRTPGGLCGNHTGL